MSWREELRQARADLGRPVALPAWCIALLVSTTLVSALRGLLELFGVST